MEAIRCLIVDDEPLGRDRIRDLLAEDPEIEIVGEATNGAEAVAALREHEVELVMLDVEMPEMDGFEVLEQIGPSVMPCVIFVTAYAEYALQAFEVHALDYLLKPFDRERFKKALNRAKAALREKTTESSHQQLLELIREVRPDHKPLDRVVVKSSGRVFFVKTSEIDWIESAGNYLKLHVGREEHLIRETLAAMESKLDPRNFCRIHRSTIVNLERVRELQPLFHGDYTVLLHDGSELTLSRNYRQKLPEDLSAMI